ncbi:hypothetical protein HYN59_13395 [Flavobacterium album]|uniref:Uncharacterized protein n=1 Tax=Flavobacterium album TaxID=2175091 RepID=A0A2S1R0B4_9FLAO|nr:hypothetical protein HYN59_13395 [Flavobacterium album]
MSLVDDPKRNWVIPPFLLIAASVIGIVYDFISFYYNLFWIVGSVITICIVFSVIFSIVNSIVMLRNYLGEKEHFTWWKVLLNLTPLLLLAYFLIVVVLY